MSIEVQWFVMQGDQSLGPYSPAQIAQFAANGNITPQTMIWAEGLESWITADQVEGLFAAQQVAPVAAPLAIHAIDPDTHYPHVVVKKGAWASWMWLLIGGLVSLGTGIVMTFIAAGMTADATADEPSSAGLIGVISAGAMFLGWTLFSLSFIPVLITLYRAWYCLQPGKLARATPGKAVGLLFIPLFNIIWAFQAYRGLATDWNRTITTYNELKAAPRLSDGVFLTFCIGLFLPPLSIIMLFGVMSQMCRGIKFFREREKELQPAGADLGSGLKIGGGFTIR